MIKSKKSMFIVISVFTLVLFLGGTTYAWFNYRKTGSNQQLIAGEIYMHFNEGNGEILLTNLFPETKEEARARDDNFITFNIDGLNTSSKTIYYEFILNHGTEKESPKSRYRDEDLRFDLVELDSNGNEVRYLLSDAGYDSIVNRRFWVDTIDANTTSELVRRYKLRMWLSEDVIISDTAENKTYTTAEYKNKYASVKLTVFGDFTEKYLAFQKVMKGVVAKENAGGSCSNITYEEDGITYLSGTNTCVDMNYVWYSGKLWRITAIYPNGQMKLITENGMTTISYNSSGNPIFYTNENNTSYVYQWLNEDFYDTLYNVDDFIDTRVKWNATNSNATSTADVSIKLPNTTLVTSKIGLLNSYEYYNGYRCIGSSGCTGTTYGSGYLNANKHYWWLLNPYTSSKVWYVETHGEPSGDLESFSNIYGVRPSIVLKSTVELVGDGTKTSPYKIVGDKSVGETNDLINTRLSGEFVLLKNGDNSRLYRIIGVEDNKTKIIDIGYVDGGTERRFATGVTMVDNKFIYGQGTSVTGSNTWYNYLNGTYLTNLKDTYGELFDSGTYYMGEIRKTENYKLALCTTATTTTKDCTKVSVNGTYDVGLPRLGEMLCSAYTYDIPEHSVWLLTRSKEYYAVYLLAYSGYLASNDTINLEGARATLHLKSTVKILSGTGTPNDPYVVGL